MLHINKELSIIELYAYRNALTAIVPYEEKDAYIASYRDVIKSIDEITEALTKQYEDNPNLEKYEPCVKCPEYLMHDIQDLNCREYLDDEDEKDTLGPIQQKFYSLKPFITLIDHICQGCELEHDEFVYYVKEILTRVRNDRMYYLARMLADVEITNHIKDKISEIDTLIKEKETEQNI